MTTWNEWDPLEEVIIGTALGAKMPRANKSMTSVMYANVSPWDVPMSGPFPEHVIEEAEEDLNTLENVLIDLDVDTYRINPTKTTKYHNFCPRDSALIVGNAIIEAPMPISFRENEVRAMGEIFEEKFYENYNWIAAPRSIPPSFQKMDPDDPNILTLVNEGIYFDAANILRCGTDLFYLVSNSGNKGGAKWLQTVIGPEFKVHVLEGIYSYMHLDSTISFLRPGLVLLNPSRINEDNLPEVLKSWDKIWCPEPVDIGFTEPYNHSSPWINMNLLMVNPGLAIVEKNQMPLIKELHKHKIDVIGAPMRHARTLGGCFHCATLDTKRKGDLESYFG